MKAARKKDFISLKDIPTKDIEKILNLSRLFKNRSLFAPRSVLRGKNIGMLFEKPSTRTRLSFEVAINHLGGRPIYIHSETTQLGRGETIRDTAKVMERYLDCIVARLYSHRSVEELAMHSGIPVINGLTDTHHPCQALADVMTIQERFKSLKGRRLVFFGNGKNNVAHSLMLACAKLRIKMTVACPEGYSPDREILSKSGTTTVLHDPEKAARGADILYTDAWVSMGEEKKKAQLARALRPYQLNKRLASLAKKEHIIMHCLPAHRGQEITGDVMDGPNSVVFEQAENRLHTAKGLLAWIFS